MVRKLSQAVIDRLMKKYKKRLGAKVGDSKQFAPNRFLYFFIKRSITA